VQTKYINKNAPYSDSVKYDIVKHSVDKNYLIF